MTHYTQDVPEYELDQGFESLSRLLETGGSDIPEPEDLGRRAVDNRSRQLIEQGDSEPYWEDEEETLRELMEAHEVQV